MAKKKGFLPKHGSLSSVVILICNTYSKSKNVFAECHFQSHIFFAVLCSVADGLPCLGENPFCHAAPKETCREYKQFATQEWRGKKIVAGHGTVVAYGYHS